MVKEYKSLYITNEAEKAIKAQKDGKYVVLCIPMDSDVILDYSKFPYAVQDLEDLSVEYLERLICRFEGRPREILRTKRCLIREITVSDVDKLYEIYREPCITAYMEDLYQDPDEERAYTRDYIKYQYGIYDYGLWIIEDLLNLSPDKKPVIIGRAGFSIREGFSSPELGYLIRKEYQGKGYATEVCKALLEYGEKELQFVEVGAFTDCHNKPSVHLLKRLGFHYVRDEVLDDISGKSKSTIYQNEKKMQYYVLTF